MNPSLIACAAGIVLYAAVLTYYLVKISREKARLKAEGKAVKKAAYPFVGSLVLCAIVELLPVLIALRFYMIVIVCLCGVLGAYLVLRERLKTLAS